MTVQFQWSIIVRIGMQKLAVTQLRHVTSVNASTITFYSPSDSAVAAMLSPASALKCCYASALAAISSVNVSATVCFDSCLAARPLGVAALQTDAPIAWTFFLCFLSCWFCWKSIKYNIL